MERKTRSIESETQRRVAISLAQGGTMLKVLPLARQGLSPTEIVRQIGKSYYAVSSSEFHLRRRGEVLPSSVREFCRQLAEILANPPREFDFRQKLLDMATFAFYRKHDQLFSTVTELCRLAECHLSSWDIHQDAVLVLRQGQVPVKTFFIKRKYNGEVVYRHYNIILAADRDDGVRALTDGFNFRQSRRLPDLDVRL